MRLCGNGLVHKTLKFLVGLRIRVLPASALGGGHNAGWEVFKSCGVGVLIAVLSAGTGAREPLQIEIRLGQFCSVCLRARKHGHRASRGVHPTRSLVVGHTLNAVSAGFELLEMFKEGVLGIGGQRDGAAWRDVCRFESAGLAGKAGD